MYFELNVIKKNIPPVSPTLSSSHREGFELLVRVQLFVAVQPQAASSGPLSPSADLHRSDRPTTWSSKP